MTRAKPNHPPNPIREARLRKGLTQLQAAAEAGYSLSHYAAIEREPRLITDRLAERLAIVFAVPREELRP